MPVVGFVVAVPLGIAAVALGVSARRQARSWGTPMGIATGGVVAGIAAMVASFLVLALPLFLTWTSDAQTIAADMFQLAPDAPSAPAPQPATRR